MKSLFYFIILVFAAIQLTGQNNITNISNKNDEEKISYKLINGTIWVRDSIHFFKEIESEWVLQRRELVTSRNTIGKMTSKIKLIVDSTGTSKNEILTKVNYYPNGILKDSIVFTWDTINNIWADTLYYQRNDGNGNILEKIKTSYNHNPSETFLVKKQNIYRYNNKSQKTYFLKRYRRENNAWENRQESFYIYYQSGIISEEINHGYAFKDYDIINPEYFIRYSYKYNLQGYDKIKIKQKKNHENEVWKNTNKYSYSYSSNHLLAFQLIERWDKDNDKWVKDLNGEYQYMDSVLIKEVWKKWKQGSLTNYSQTIYKYDSTGRLINELTQSWNENNQEWHHYSEFIYKYNEHNKRTLYAIIRFDKKKYKFINEFDTLQNLIKYIFMIGDENNDWINRQKGIISYNDSNTIIYSDYYWNKEDSIWVKSLKITEYYDDIHNLAEKITIRYTYNLSEIRTKSVYFWSKLNITETRTAEKGQIVIYPNPAGDYIYLKNIDRKTLAYIYSNTGAFLKYTSVQPDEKIDISFLHTGIYFIKTDIDNKTYKLIVK